MKHKNFLLDKGGNERVAGALTSTPTAKAKQIAFSDTLTKIFLKTRREIINRSSPLESSSTLLETITEEEEDFDITESSTVSSGIELDFFTEGEKNKEKLYEKANEKVGILNESNKKFIDYLSTRYGEFHLSKNKIKTHLESGQIFQDNNLSNENLYDFLSLQQDSTKKELDITIPVGNDFNVYVREILTEAVDDDFDLQTNPTSKFLFYNFNTFRQLQ